MNSLARADDFKRVLADYHVSEGAKDLLARLQLVLLVGPSSAGRNTIINELLKSGKYHFIVSDTTRQPRVNDGVLEENGKQYWFRTEDEVLQDLEAGEFLEAAIIHNQQVSGISMRELAAAVNEQKVAINEIEVVGADHIHAVKPDALFLFILPPSFDEWMVRMNTRGSLPADETRRRLTSAVKELTMALDRDYYRFVVNDTFVHTAAGINKMTLENARSEKHQAEGIAVAQQLLTDTKKFLETN
ncbi:MAG: guanylate kinase [Candidatus Saccharibacteria bacterium]|nr:guanylate kinase [Candidatus Saccharibacteria bacterium]